MAVELAIIIYHKETSLPQTIDVANMDQTIDTCIFKVTRFNRHVKAIQSVTAPSVYVRVEKENHSLQTYKGPLKREVHQLIHEHCVKSEWLSRG